MPAIVHGSGLLTEERYQHLLDAQSGSCAICQREPDAQRLAVDHDHTTGKVRGLLCTRCNMGLGHFRDDLDLLERAIGYLLDARVQLERATELGLAQTPVLPTDLERPSRRRCKVCHARPGEQHTNPHRRPKQ